MPYGGPSPVRDLKATVINSAASPASIDYPDDIGAGDRLVLVIAVDDSQTITVAGWTKHDEDVNNDTVAVFSVEADGTETGTFPVAFTTTNRDLSSVVYSVKDGGVPTAATATGTSATPSPPGLTPGAGDYLYIAGSSTDIGPFIRSAWPEGFGGWITLSATGGSVALHSAYRAQSGNLSPTAFTATGSSAWVAYTVAVPVTYPSSAGWPVVEGLAAKSTWAAGTSQTMNLPSGIAAGDYLVAEIGLASGTAVPSATGWTVFDSVADTFESAYLLVREADGTEGATVTVTLSASSSGGTVVRRWSGVDPTKTDAQITAFAASSTMDPPSLTPADGSDNIGWVTGYTGDTINAVYRFIADAETPWPKNYGVAAAWLNLDSGVYSGVFHVAAATQNPTSIPMEAPRRHIAWTYALYPAATPPPDAPTNPSATAISDSQINVAWDDVADETGYRVERSPDGVGSWVDVSGNLAAGTTSYADTGLTAETQYFYRVIAFNDGGDSTPSTVVNATTQAAGGGNRMGGNGAIRRKGGPR